HDRVCVWRVFDGIGEQNKQDLPQTIPVPVDGPLCCSFDQQVMGGCSLQVLDHFMHQFIHINRFLRQLELTCLHPGDIEQVNHQFGEIGDLVLHFGEMPHKVLPVLRFKLLSQE